MCFSFFLVGGSVFRWGVCPLRTPSLVGSFLNNFPLPYWIFTFQKTKNHYDYILLIFVNFLLTDASCVLFALMSPRFCHLLFKNLLICGFTSEMFPLSFIFVWNGFSLTVFPCKRCCAHTLLHIYSPQFTIWKHKSLWKIYPTFHAKLRLRVFASPAKGMHAKISPKNHAQRSTQQCAQALAAARTQRLKQVTFTTVPAHIRRNYRTIPYICILTVSHACHAKVCPVDCWLLSSCVLWLCQLLIEPLLD